MESSQSADHRNSRAYLAALTLGALGVVYGDIGTSPLYALRECFGPHHHLSVIRENVLGVLSLILWSLIIVVSVKYMAFVLRANNKGEGGVLALLALVSRRFNPARRRDALLLLLGVFGAALLYGDGMITPSISVLSAMEGLNITAPRLAPYVVPLTIVVLVGLFSIQRFGTHNMGKVFGPIMLIWFLTLAVLGIRGMTYSPGVLLAVNPVYAAQFFLANGWHGFMVLGSVFLAVTGAESLYADMGHFGLRPIRRAWFALVLPALALNYFGQGAMLLHDPAAAGHPFYFLAPRWAVLPLVALATCAAVIASQALISGVFSLTVQAIQLGYVPRMDIRHTSHLERGQIYLPLINWVLMLACIGLVLGFRTSSNLAAAYGIAVALTMFITTVLFSKATHELWGWPLWKTALICSLFGIPELAFFGANALKIPHGGWFPLVAAGCIFTLLATWKTGRALIRKRLQGSQLPFDLFLADLDQSPVTRVEGTAVFLAGNPHGTPVALLHNLKHNKVIHERVIVLTVSTADVPHVDPAQRVEVRALRPSFFQVIGRFGFMEDPSVPELLEQCALQNLLINPMETTYFLSRETILPSKVPGMWLWRERLFALMSRNAQRATSFFHIPPNRVVELGIQIEL